MGDTTLFPPLESCKELVRYSFTFLLAITYCFSFAAGKVPPRENSNLRFIENKGQWHSYIEYAAEIKSGSLLFEKDRFTFLFWKLEGEAEDGHLHDAHIDGGYIFRLVFDGANPNVKLLAGEKETWYRNYFQGNQPQYWKGNVGVFGKLTYQNIYPGIDLEVFGSGEAMKYQFVVQPGADASLVRWHYEGVEQLRLEKEELRYKFQFGEVRELEPVVYQIKNGKGRVLPSNYKLNGNSCNVQLEYVADYDSSQLLVIDPTLIFSSYTGSTADNFGFTATYDDNGDFYAGGNVYAFTQALNPGSGLGQYPTVGAVQWQHQGGVQDIAISKFSSNGTTLLYSTYLGGTLDDLPHSLVVNNNHELYVLGTSASNNFPVVTGSYDETWNGMFDITVTKFNTAGNSLLGSTFVGGSGTDGHNNSAGFATFYNFGDSSRGEIIVDSSSNVYVATCTKSSDFPVSGGAYQTAYGGGLDAVILKLNPNLTALTWATYLGGNLDDAAYSVKLDKTGNVFATGGTQGSSFPTTAGVYHSTYQGGVTDGFIAKLNSSATALTACTYTGTSAYDQCYFVEVDDSNYVYVVGQTLGAFPVSGGVYSNPNTTQFVQQLSNDLSTSMASSTFGSGSTAVNISPTAFLVDECFNVYVAGWGGNVNHVHNGSTGNTFNMPTTADALQTTSDGSELYFIVYTNSFQNLLFASYYGGNGANEHVDGGTSRFDPQGIIYISVCAGCGGNSNFPASPGAYSTTNQSNNCNLAALKIDLDLGKTEVDAVADPVATGCVPLTVNFQTLQSNATQFEWYFGDGGTSNLQNPVHTYVDTGHYVAILIGIDPLACIPSDTVYLNIWVRDDSLVANFINGLDVDCDSLKVSISADSVSPYTVYQWDFGDGATASGMAAVHYYSAPGTYNITLTITDTSKCELQATFTAPIFLQTDFTAQIQMSDTAGCPPVSIQFGIANSTAQFYQWFFGDGTSSYAPSPIHYYPVSGLYDVWLVVVDTNSCFITDTVYAQVNIYENPVAAFTVEPDTVRYGQGFDFFNQSTNYQSLQWEFGDNSTSTYVNPTHYYALPGDYHPCLRVWNGNCADTVCDDVVVVFTPLVGVPNAFSPNKDGLNDVLYVEGEGIVEMTFRVFNRWGEKVFESKDQGVGWDGTYKGALQDMDSFAYTLDVTFVDGKTSFLKGNITLLR